MGLRRRVMGDDDTQVGAQSGSGTALHFRARTVTDLIGDLGEFLVDGPAVDDDGRDGSL